MKTVTQPVRLIVENLDTLVSGTGCHEGRTFKHGRLLPDTIRCIIVAPSNCGKTNIMLSLLIDANGLRFENVYLYTKTPQQPKYQFLARVLRAVKGIGFFAYNDNADIIAPGDAKRNSIFIFDDVSCDKQNTMMRYFSMGRHSGVDSFYLSQTYARIPKHLIRDNANFIILFRQDDMNLRHIFSDHVNTDMSFEAFKRMCGECWSSDKHGFLIIDKDSALNAGRYRKGFNSYIIVDTR